MHILLVVLSSAVLLVSIAAQLRKRNSRYMFLTLAFGFLTLSQSVELVETLFMSNQLVTVPIAGIHLSHLLDLLMLSSFGLALFRK